MSGLHGLWTSIDVEATVLAILVQTLILVSSTYRLPPAAIVPGRKGRITTVQSTHHVNNILRYTTLQGLELSMSMLMPRIHAFDNNLDNLDP